MSSYTKQTKHPKTGEWHDAWWLDDYFGKHRYGVQFPDGSTFDPEKVTLETREGEQPTVDEKKGESWRLGFMQGITEERARILTLITHEIGQAHIEGTRTSRLTSLYMRITNNEQPQ